MVEVLLAEDDKFCQTVTKALLGACGGKVTVANDGNEAISAVTTNPGKFKLILMDFDMPECDGFQASAAIKTLDPNIPIVGLSADHDEELVAKSQAVGMMEICQKPVKKPALAELLQKYAA